MSPMSITTRGAPHQEKPRDDTGTIEKRFNEKQLGSYRGTLLQALAEYDIAAHEEEKTASLKRQQIVGEHPMVVALHTRQGLQAKLEGAIEQVGFDSAQEKRLAIQAPAPGRGGRRGRGPTPANPRRFGGYPEPLEASRARRPPLP